MAERVAGRRRGAAQRPQRRRPQPQAVAHVVQTERVGQLRVEQRHHMAPRRERARLGVNAVLAGELRDEVGRNQFDELPQHRRLCPARLAEGFFFTPCLVAGNLPPAEPLFKPLAVGWLWSQT